MKGVRGVRVFNFSLRKTLTIGVAAGILVPALFFVVFQATSRYKAEVALRIDAPSAQYADVLSRGMAVAVWNLDRGVAVELVDAVMRNPDVISVTVSDEFGEHFVKRGDDLVDLGHQRSAERDIIYNGAQVGRLSVIMSTRRTEAEARDDLFRYIGALLLQLALAFAVILPLFRLRIVQPISRLREDATRLARGDLSQPVSPQQDDELGPLANSLEAMRIDLGAVLREREQKNLALQRELEERARTEQALRDSQAQVTAIFESSPVALAVSTFNEEVIALDVNNAWCRVFGLQRDQVIGVSGRETGIWSNLQARDEALERLRSTGELTAFRAWMRRGAHGAEIYCELSGRVVRLGKEQVLIMAFEDITERHRYDENILQLNATLEHRVQERTQELTDALGQLRAAQSELVRTEKMSALGSLVAGIAHELNTPIGNSLTVASTLQDHANHFQQSMSKGLTRSRLDEFVTNTQQGAGILMRGLQHAAELVASFKQVAVDQTSENRRSFELHHTVSEILLTLGPTIRKTPHSVTSEIPADIVLDSYPGPFGQILTNLINNALIHAFDAESTEAGTVHISARLDGTDQLVFMVSDNGRGIPKAHLARVFDPFFTTRLGQGGSGLGLNIVYNLVTKTLGGTIDVSNRPEGGACFCIRMPVVAPVIAPEPVDG
jgi:PAS domain S-box-containing protein